MFCFFVSESEQMNRNNRCYWCISCISKSGVLVVTFLLTKCIGWVAHTKTCGEACVATLLGLFVDRSTQPHYWPSVCWNMPSDITDPLCVETNLPSVITNIIINMQRAVLINKVDLLRSVPLIITFSGIFSLGHNIFGDIWFRDDNSIFHIHNPDHLVYIYSLFQNQKWWIGTTGDTGASDVSPRLVRWSWRF